MSDQNKPVAFTLTSKNKDNISETKVYNAQSVIKNNHLSYICDISKIEEPSLDTYFTTKICYSLGRDGIAKRLENKYNLVFNYNNENYEDLLKTISNLNKETKQS